MTTVSVPLTPELLHIVDQLVADGVATNKADAIRRAIKKYGEDREVEAILQAMQEPDLEGGIDELAAKLS